MKNIFKAALVVLLASTTLTSCELEEWNPSTVDLETAYKYKDGFESLVNYCYDGLYYFYGKIDGIGAMEMGTDLWDSEGKEVDAVVKAIIDKCVADHKLSLLETEKL